MFEKTGCVMEGPRCPKYDNDFVYWTDLLCGWHFYYKFTSTYILEPNGTNRLSPAYYCLQNCTCFPCDLVIIDLNYVFSHQTTLFSNSPRDLAKYLDTFSNKWQCHVWGVKMTPSPPNNISMSWKLIGINYGKWRVILLPSQPKPCALQYWSVTTQINFFHHDYRTSICTLLHDWGIAM